MSLTETIPAAIDAKPAKERRISKRMQQALVLLATKGKTQRDAAKEAGLSEWHLSHELKKPHIRVFIERCVREKMALGTLRASERMLELVDCSSLTTSFDASKHVLAIAGIKPSSDAHVTVNVDIKAGYVIDLTGGDQPMREVKAVTLMTDALGKSE